ncbi:hypothetical protein A8F94_17995 [Bacillus sp. FJAT-27225]|uniref:hypothetical protein n=1 Tax=Bacillus sp. FJAT-27225 TaxID=1743144 RepID=UPI00080C2B9E|nr:hypothetical protein [Bacillus sp. FJAT-27225]OCA83037.1 hypothetical protein A8F94_17995 [Bacillus sp. FJAT-27225]
MANLTLAEAVKLKSILNKRVHELEMEMDRVAFAEIEKGSKPPKQPRSLQEVEQDLEDIRKDMRVLDRLVYAANIGHAVNFNGEELPIVEAIELATQLRAKARKYKEFGSAQKEEFPYSYAENNSIIKVALFDPEDYRQKGIEAERQANRLSNLINGKNYSIELAFDADKYF